MATFLYRCPITGQKVQGWVADDVFDVEPEAFECISCSACGQAPPGESKNRKVVGADDPHSGVLRRSRVDPEHAANVNPQTTTPAPHTRYLKKLVDARYAHAECPAFATARP